MLRSRIALIPALIPLVCLAMVAGCNNDGSQKIDLPVDVAPAVPETPVVNADWTDKLGEVEADAPTAYTKTPSGLQYRILRKGTGAKPTRRDTVKVHYRGWLDNGKDFDSSYDRNEPIEFPLSGVIPGWTEGMQYVNEGGKIELVIPSNLGYGAAGAGADIPPNSRLHFVVELLNIKK